MIRRVKVSVGVSVSGNLLDLNISTEDIDSERTSGYPQKLQGKEKILSSEKRRICKSQRPGTWDAV